jgi:dipeptidyl aminopeptidase/acylaminoacyl peptidase
MTDSTASWTVELPARPDGGRVRLLVHAPRDAADGPLPWAILAPGHATSVALGFWPLAAATLARHGIVAVGCQFSGSGYGDDLEECSELERCSTNTYGAELDDLAETARWVRSQSAFDPDRGFVIGHSRGGGMGVVHAAEDRRYAGVVTWNGMDSILRFSPERLSEWRERGVIEVWHWGARTKVQLRDSVLDDGLRNRPRYEPRAAAARLGCPLLAVQGSRDEAVRPEEAERLVAAAADARLVRVEDGDHTFGMPIRMRAVKSTPAFEQALDATVRFLVERAGPAAR